MPIDFVKVVMFALPFLRELLLGRAPSNSRGSRAQRAPLGRRLLVLGVVLSALGNAYFVNRLFALGTQNLALSREIEALKVRPQAVQVAPTPPVALAPAPRLPEPAPVPMTPKVRTAVNVPSQRARWEGELSKIQHLDQYE